MFGDVYYSDPQIQVTDEWIKVRDKAYPVCSIKSARLSKVPTDPMLVWAKLLRISSIILFAGAIVAYYFAVSRALDLNFFIAVLLVLGVQNLIIAYFLGESRKQDYNYVVDLRGQFGRTYALASKDEFYAQEVVDAIREVMRMYR